MGIPHEILELPDDFSQEVRLFPLPGLVFFPHNVQPLHIFESRYREMLEDALAGDRLLAMATLQPGYEVDYYSRPAVERAVCIGRVVSHQRNADGTYDLILVGIRRACIHRELSPPRAFRRAMVEVLQDDGEDGLSREAKQLGRQLAARFKAIVPAAEKLVDDFLQGRVSLGALTDVIAFHLPLDIDVKLTLLAETDVVGRARLLLSKLPAPTVSPRESFPPGFSEN